MAKQIINVNTPNDLINVTPTANSRQGDPLRSAFIKINDALDRIDANFTELYTFTGADAPANELVNGSQVVSLSSTGVLTMPDGLTIADSVIGYASSQTITEETVGGITSETTANQSQIEIATNSVVIERKTTVTVDDGVTTSVDEAGSRLEVNNLGTFAKHYVEPDGPNNSSYFQFSTSNLGAVIEGIDQAPGSTTTGRITVTQGVVEILASIDATDKNWIFDRDGILTLPSGNYLETIDSNLQVGSQGIVTIRSNALSSDTTRSWTFDKSGTITTPLMLPLTFYPVLDSEHMTRGVGLTDAPWEFEVQFQVNPDGTVQTSINNPAWPSNPGYIDGDEFVYVEADHGIPGYTFSLILNNIVLGEGWTANLAVSQPPAYPSTLLSQGAVKLTSNTHSLVLGTDGNLTVPGAVKQGNSKLHLNVDGGTNVYLTSTLDDSTAVFINNSSVQAYATELVSLQVGSGLAALELLWQELEQLWIDVRDQDAADIAPATRAWAGLPSYQAYDIIVATFPVEPAAPGNLVPVANNAKNAYNDWQIAIADTSVSIAAGEYSWTFDATGNLQLPVGGDIVNSTGTSVISDQSLNSTDQVQFDRVIATNYLQTAEYKYTGNISGYGSLPVTVAGSSTTVVYSYDNWNTSTKLVFQVEGELDGDTEFVNHTQTCEATVAATFNTAAEPAMSVYGIVHTSATPLATFSVRRGEGLTAGKIEILATNSQTTNNMVVKVQSLQFVSRYD